MSLNITFLLLVAKMLRFKFVLVCAFSCHFFSNSLYTFYSYSMGLASYACTRDLGRAWRLSDQLQSGMVGINEGSIGMSFAPFGGIKQSGLGSEGGSYGLNEYLVTKYTCMGHGYAPA